MKNANPLSGLITRPSALVGALLAFGCQLLMAADATSKAPVKSVTDAFVMRIGNKELRVQVAVAPTELQKGLMFRRSLKADEAMLFVFGAPQQMSFYMRNTSIPLHIGYFDADGVLREMYPLYPFDETPVKSRNEELRYALEVNQGWFNENQVKVGARIDLQAIKGALKARGFDPTEFGFKK